MLLTDSNDFSLSYAVLLSIQHLAHRAPLIVYSSDPIEPLVS